MDQVQYLSRKLADHYKGMVKSHPEITLGELKEKLEKAQEQCKEVTNEEFETSDLPSLLSEELFYWEECTEDTATAECWQYRIHELATCVEALIEKFGKDISVGEVAHLPCMPN